MSSSGGDDEEDAVYYESLERILSYSSAYSLDFKSAIDEEEERVDADSLPDGLNSDRFLVAPEFPMECRAMIYGCRSLLRPLKSGDVGFYAKWG
ncbi:unnamed protein product [Rhodiola kirilowii]